MIGARGRQARRGGLGADRTGTAAIEFALLFPILLVLFIGSYELENYLLAYLKVSAAAETAADIVAQTDIFGGAGNNGVLQTSDFTNFTSATADVLTPLPTGTNNSLVQLAFASVTYSTGGPKIDWHVEENGAAAITTANVPNNALAGLGTASSTDSVIVVQMQYTYTSPFVGYVLTNSSYTISATAFNRPRYLNCIPSAATTTSDAVSPTTGLNVCP
jgi:Flp pilus assembly protein TadG